MASSFPLLKEAVLYRVMEFEFGTSLRGLNAGPMQIGTARSVFFRRLSSALIPSLLARVCFKL